MKPKLFDPLDKLNVPEPDDFYAHCRVGHDTHETKTVRVPVDGFDELLAVDIYDWEHYFTTVAGNETTPKYAEYCTGQDIISYCIDRQGVWEKEETATILDILREDNADKIMLDFGSHIGWYTNLALKLGYRVASFDANIENLGLLRQSAVMNGTVENSYPYLCWLDFEVPVLSSDAEEVQLVKVDVEGAEHHALQMISQLIGQHKVKYAIFEISPVFNGNYPALVSTIQKFGYDVYQLPSGQWEHQDEFAQSPLTTIKKYCEITQRGDELKAYVDSLHQENFLFVRRDNA